MKTGKGREKKRKRRERKEKREGREKKGKRKREEEKRRGRDLLLSFFYETPCISMHNYYKQYFQKASNLGRYYLAFCCNL